MSRAFQLKGESMSIPVLIAFCLAVVVIGGMAIGFGRLANDGEDSSKRRLREAKKAQKET